MHFFRTRQRSFELLRDRRLVPLRLVRQYRAEQAELPVILGALLRSEAERGTLRDGLDVKLAAEGLMGMIRGPSCRTAVTPRL